MYKSLNTLKTQTVIIILITLYIYNIQWLQFIVEAAISCDIIFIL